MLKFYSSHLSQLFLLFLFLNFPQAPAHYGFWILMHDFYVFNANINMHLQSSPGFNASYNQHPQLLSLLDCLLGFIHIHCLPQLGSLHSGITFSILITLSLATPRRAHNYIIQFHYRNAELWIADTVSDITGSSRLVSVRAVE